MEQLKNRTGRVWKSTSVKVNEVMMEMVKTVRAKQRVTQNKNRRRKQRMCSARPGGVQNVMRRDEL